MGGWFRKEIKHVDDMKGSRCASALRRLVMAQARRRAQADRRRRHLPVAREGHDRRRRVGRSLDDQKLGFNKIAPYYYYPGGGRAAPRFIPHRLDQWNELPKGYQTIVRAACEDAGA